MKSTPTRDISALYYCPTTLSSGFLSVHGERSGLPKSNISGAGLPMSEVPLTSNYKIHRAEEARTRTLIRRSCMR